MRRYSQSAENIPVRIRALVRDLERAEDLRPLAGELIEIDYRDPQSLHAGLEGADAVVHLAGALKPKRGETLQEANVATTKSIVDASLAARVNCFIYLSHPEADPASRNAYYQTKGAAEVIIREAGFAGAIFRVPMILGAGNTSLDALVQMAQAPLAPLIGGGSVRVQPVYQSDVTTAIDWALSTCPAPMKVINLVGPETITYAHLLQRVALRIGKHPKVFPVPKTLAKLAVWLASGFSRTASANRTLLETVFEEHLIDPAETKNQIPFSLTPVNEMLDRTFPPPESI